MDLARELTNPGMTRGKNSYGHEILMLESQPKSHEESVHSRYETTQGRGRGTGPTERQTVTYITMKVDHSRSISKCSLEKLVRQR